MIRPSSSGSVSLVEAKARSRQSLSEDFDFISDTESCLNKSLLSFECPQAIQSVFDLFSFRMMVSVALNVFESQLNCLFRCNNALRQLLRIEFKYCGT